MKNGNVIDIKFTADMHGCINHRCTARVVLGENGEFDILDWSDGYCDYQGHSLSDSAYESLKEEVEYLVDDMKEAL